MPKGEKNRKLSDDQRNEIIRRYCAPLANGTTVGVPTLAREYGVTNNAIYTLFKYRGVVTRSASEAQIHKVRRPPIDRGVPPLCKCGCGIAVEWHRKRKRWKAYATGHYRSDAAYKDREWLLEHYVQQRMTAGEIAAMFGVYSTTVVKAMKRHGIDRRGGSEAHVGRQVGAKNPAWKGGATPERQRFYKTPEWKSLVRTCLARDGFRCRRCGAPKTRQRGLHAHHVLTWAEHPELRAAIGNVVTLCTGCHLWVHSRQNVLRDFLI